MKCYINTFPEMYAVPGTSVFCIPILEQEMGRNNFEIIVINFQRRVAFAFQVRCTSINTSLYYNTHTNTHTQTHTHTHTQTQTHTHKHIHTHTQTQTHTHTHIHIYIYIYCFRHYYLPVGTEIPIMKYVSFLSH
jgi:hypothetical protein